MVEKSSAEKIYDRYLSDLQDKVFVKVSDVFTTMTLRPYVQIVDMVKEKPGFYFVFNKEGKFRGILELTDVDGVSTVPLKDFDPKK